MDPVDREQFISEPESRIGIIEKHLHFHFDENEDTSYLYGELFPENFFEVKIKFWILQKLLQEAMKNNNAKIIKKVIKIYPKSIENVHWDSFSYNIIKNIQSDEIQSNEIKKYFNKDLGKNFVNAFFYEKIDLLNFIMDDFDDIVERINSSYFDLPRFHKKCISFDAVQAIIHKKPDFFSKINDFSLCVDNVQTINLLVIENYGKKINPKYYCGPTFRDLENLYVEISLKDYIGDKNIGTDEILLYFASICEDFVYSAEKFKNDFLTYSTNFIDQNDKFILKVINRRESKREISQLKNIFFELRRVSDFKTGR